MSRQVPNQPDDRDVRCPCGQLIARWTHNGVEIKCNRCRRVVCILFKSMKEDALRSTYEINEKGLVDPILTRCLEDGMTRITVGLIPSKSEQSAHAHP